MYVNVREIYKRLAILMMIGQGDVRIVALIMPESLMENLEFTYGYCIEHDCYELHIVDSSMLKEGDKQLHQMEEMTPFESLLEEDAAEFWKKFGIG